MSSPGNAQHQLYTKASEVFGPENADTLMSGLVFRDDLATKADIDRFATKVDLEVLKNDFQALDRKLDLMGSALNGRIDEMGATLNGRIDTLSAELRGEIQATVAQAVAEMNRSMRNWMGTVVVTIIAALAGTQLLP